MGESKVADFYQGRELFVTGATGFLGKALMHKLLTACPEIGTIYVLIRPKKGQAPMERLKALLGTTIFNGLDENLLDKVVAVAGDIMLPGLGLAQKDRARLTSGVSVIFNSAGNVNFEEDLSKSVKVNIQGTMALLNLAHEIGSNLASFVHVSTAYSHCYMSYIDEKFYANEYLPDQLIQMAEEKSATVIDESKWTKKLIGKHPNTYTFTKALAEQAVLDNANNLPIAIFRPSIVTAASKEPLPGWVDNLNGPTGAAAAVASGIWRTAQTGRTTKIDFIPVDFVVSMMCVIGWKTGSTAINPATKMDIINKNHLSRAESKSTAAHSIPIYNFTSGADRPLKVREYSKLFLSWVEKYPFEDMFWVPKLIYCKSVIDERVCVAVFSFLPAFVLDAFLRLMGKKPCMWRLTKKIAKAVNALQFFLSNEWKWSNENVHRLNGELTDADKDVFQCNLKELPSWDSYMELYCLGIRHYVLKNSPSSIASCRRKYKWLSIADTLIQLLALSLLIQLVYNIFWK